MSPEMLQNFIASKSFAGYSRRAVDMLGFKLVPLEQSVRAQAEWLRNNPSE